MPPIVFVVAAGVAAYAGYRWINSQLASSDAAARRAAADIKSPTSEGTDSTSQHAKDLGTLEWDEAAGAYRPKRMN